MFREKNIEIFGNNILDAPNVKPVKSDYDVFEHICEDAFEDGRGYIALLVVYFDATYNHPKPDSEAPVMHSLGAYVGRVEHWRKFSKEWRIELNKKGLDHFHMTDFEFAQNCAINGRELPHKEKYDCYRGWAKEDFISFLRRLHQVINQKNRKGNYRLESITSTVLKKDFDETIPPELISDVQCSSYYIFNVVQVLKVINHFLKLQKDNVPIHYVFAGGDGEGGRLGDLFDDMWEDPVANSVFRLSKSYARMPYEIKKMKETPALQAADIAAFEMQKFALKMHELNYPLQVPKDLFRTSLVSLGKTRHGSFIYRKTELEKSFAEIIEHNKMREHLKTL